jgi:hypothetical protein
MTKNLLILSMFILGTLKLNAQCTPDNTITKAGFYPDSLPPVQINQQYNQVLQFKIFKDTTVLVFGTLQKATIDSANIQKVIGLPTGITFKLNKLSQTYTPAEVGCALISGTTSTAGKYKLGIVLLVHAKVSGFPVSRLDTLKSFYIQVNDPSANIPTFSESINRLYPNPLKSNTLYFESIPQVGSVLSIYNAQGQLLVSKSLTGTEKSMDFNYPSGYYLVTINNGSLVYRTKIIKE